MKMIDVLNLMAEGKIEDGTKLEIYDPVNTFYTYTFNGKYKSFYSNTEYSMELGNYFKINDNFLNYEVELIPPKEKEYLVKFNMRGLGDGREYLNLDYYKRGYECVHLSSKYETSSIQTRFTKSELESIKAVREFLEDMQGKYELIEVD